MTKKIKGLKNFLHSSQIKGFRTTHLKSPPPKKINWIERLNLLDTEQDRKK